MGSTRILVVILQNLMVKGDAGTVGGVVKCVEINWNTKGEGRHLGGI